MSFDIANDRLLSPVRLGALELPNRVVMAPLTRMRALPGRVPGPLAVEYYRQRASAGLIVSEATGISPTAHGYPSTPGIHSPEQIEGWKQVTQAVHEAGGRIVLQLWHVGRVSHRSHQPDGVLPVSPSALGISKGKAITASFQQEPYPVPRALVRGEIPGIISDYEQAARNAKEAGFDGVEVHNANGYLLDQFLRDGSNQRKDGYGGDVQKRSRLTLEVVEAVSDIWGADRVGIRFSPSGTVHDMRDSDPLATFGYVLRELSGKGLAYAHITQVTAQDIAHGSVDTLPVAALRPHFDGPVISAGGFTRESGEQALSEGWLDAVAYGVPFIANPDLPKRFALRAPLNEPDRKTFYGGDATGYVDYAPVGASDHASYDAKAVS